MLTTVPGTETIKWMNKSISKSTYLILSYRRECRGKTFHITQTRKECKSISHRIITANELQRASKSSFHRWGKLRATAFLIHWIFVSPYPKFIICCCSKTQCDGIWKSGLWEAINIRLGVRVEALMIELVPLEESLESLLYLFIGTR